MVNSCSGGGPLRSEIFSNGERPEEREKEHEIIFEGDNVDEDCDDSWYKSHKSKGASHYYS